jgi:beta-glucosidase
MKRIASLLILLAIALSACQANLPLNTPAAAHTPESDSTSQAPTVEPAITLAPALTTSPDATAPPVPATQPAGDLYLDPTQPPEKRAEDLLSRMTLDEKIGQMTQVDRNVLTPQDVAAYFIGSVLSGGSEALGNEAQDVNNAQKGWADMVDGFQDGAMQTRLRIPIIYGVDAVHGAASVYGATIFPHEIGLGAADDPALVEQIGRATAEELAASGVRWNFAPFLAVPQDIRWGRTYENFSENTDLVTRLGAAYIKGLQNTAPKQGLSDPLAVLASPKAFLGDGGTTWGSSTTNVLDHAYILDQGDTRVDEATLRRLYLPPYQAAVDAGALNIMVSFSSWNGTRMHAHKYLLTDVLKGELGFKGFLVSDWGGINQVSPDYYTAVVTSINAGLDMAMVSNEYKDFIDAVKSGVSRGDIPQSRVDDAVRRILTVKFEMGLFERPYSDPAALSLFGTQEHKDLARRAVQESLVLLKNDHQALPLSRDASLILVAGEGANDIGMQSGGWTIHWQGQKGDHIPGTTILQGIQEAVSPETEVEYSRFGVYAYMTGKKADVGIVVIGEDPYAEGWGDKSDLSLQSDLVAKVKEQANKVIVIVLSGRPVVLGEDIHQWDAVVAAWLPGSEGGGIADVLFGEAPFTGKLPYTWPRSNSQLPFDFNNLPAQGCSAPLFPFGYGLKTGDPSPSIPNCP